MTIKATTVGTWYLIGRMPLQVCQSFPAECDGCSKHWWGLRTPRGFSRPSPVSEDSTPYQGDAHYLGTYWDRRTWWYQLFLGENTLKIPLMKMWLPLFWSLQGSPCSGLDCWFFSSPTFLLNVGGTFHGGIPHFHNMNSPYQFLTWTESWTQSMTQSVLRTSSQTIEGFDGGHDSLFRIILLVCDVPGYLDQGDCILGGISCFIRA